MFRLVLPTVLLLTAQCGQAAETSKVAQRWAVLVGVDDYAYAEKLQYCGADQVALSEQLVASGFPQDQVFLLHDKAENPRFRPSLGNIERQLGLVLNLADADDLVVISFSGHGVHLNGKSYLCPAECTLDDPETLISVDRIYDRLKECAADFKLVLVDACRNDPRPGGGRSMTATAGTRALARTLQELKLPEGVVLLNSCAPGEVSWEDEKLGHGVFMHFVLDGLQGAADTGGDGHISLMELQAYAGGRTKTFVANRHAVAQRPFFKGDLTTEALEYALLPVPGVALKRFDKSKPASLGIWIDDDELKPVVWGLVPGGTGDTAGVLADDLIQMINGKKMVNGGDVLKAVEACRPSDQVEFVVLRNGSPLTFGGKVEARSDQADYARLKKAAEAGDPGAMAFLGNMLFEGSESVPEDVDEAVRWFRAAADAGDAVGYYRLGRLYYFGMGVEQDYAEAVRLFDLARTATGPLAHEGAFGCAAKFLGDMYRAGDGVAADLPRAVELFREAADVGHSRALFSLGKRYRYGEGVPQDDAQALQLFQKAAELHLAVAETDVALMLDYGLGAQRDPQAARNWYERAIEHGDPNAEINLGVMCENGEGGPSDIRRAVALYQSAADKGLPMAMKNLGICYKDGTGVTQDYAKAMELFKASAEKGYARSEESIGNLYYLGQGVPVDYEQARAWYERAADNGVAGAQYRLGYMYREAIGVPQDYARAMKYYQAAAATKYAAAETDIGFMIENGLGVQSDLAVARGWYEAAAAHGSAAAMYNLAIMHKRGEGGPKDLVKAAEWYRKAADLGDEDAKKALEDLP